MTIPQSDDVADDGHDGAGSAEAQRRLPPLLRVDATQPQFPGDEVVGSFFGQVDEDLTQRLQRPLAPVARIGAQSLRFQ